jgi:hypothetical protein
VVRTGTNLSGTSTVNFATVAGGTATGGVCSTLGVDYVSTSGTLTFDPGVTSLSVEVKLCNDLLTENPSEYVQLSLSNPVGATIGSQNNATLMVLDAVSEFQSTIPIVVGSGGTASPYPSVMGISGYQGPIDGLRLTLFDVTVAMPDDMMILLVDPSGTRKFLIAASVGGTEPLHGATITLEDSAMSFLSDSTVIPEGWNYKPTSCNTSTADFPAPAPSGPYIEPGCGPETTNTFASVFGGVIPNGSWSLYVVGLSSASVDSIGGWGIQFMVPTAAEASISGLVLTSYGAGIANARVTVWGGEMTQPFMTVTGSFGFYRVDGLPAGRTYFVSVNARRYTFVQPVRTVNVNEDVTGLDFTADP